MVFTSILSAIGLAGSLFPQEQKAQNPTLVTYEGLKPDYGLLIGIGALLLVTFLAIKYLK